MPFLRYDASRLIMLNILVALTLQVCLRWEAIKARALLLTVWRRAHYSITRARGRSRRMNQLRCYSLLLQYNTSLLVLDHQTHYMCTAGMQLRSFSFPINMEIK